MGTGRHFLQRGREPPYGPMSDLTDDAFDTHGLHVRAISCSAIWSCRYCQIRAVRRGDVSSTLAWPPRRCWAARASPTAVFRSARNLAGELGPTNVRSLHRTGPGEAESPGVWANEDSGQANATRSKPLRRIGERTNRPDAAFPRRPARASSRASHRPGLRCSNLLGQRAMPVFFVGAQVYWSVAEFSVFTINAVSYYGFRALT